MASSDEGLGDPSFYCDKCEYSASRRANFSRHLKSRQHSHMVFLRGGSNYDEASLNQEQNDDKETTTVLQPQTQEDENNESMDHMETIGQGENQEGESGQTYFPADEDHTATQESEWYPFTSKLEMLCYSLMSSASHPVSEEVIKFFLFILKEAGIENVPSLQRLKSLKFGNLDWEIMITKETDREGIPFWIIKPSEILKLLISNPTVSKKIIRKPRERNTISHPSNAVKWTNVINFDEGIEDEQPVVKLPVNLFLDDTSTHRSKRWLPLHCIQMQLSGLPTCERMKQASVVFVGASEKTDIMDIGKSVVNNISECEREGVVAYDAYKKEECIVKTCVDVVVADFAMMSYCCNHLGAAATKYCPRCFADSDHFDTIGTVRDPMKTRRSLMILDMRSLERDKQQQRKAKGIKEHPNCFWDIINPHSDIPVGLLHLIPLGLAKHLVKYIINSETLNKLSAHLEALVPGHKFVEFFKYIDSRQGKDFKQYLQIAPFNMRFAGVPNKFIKMVSCLALIQYELNMDSFTGGDLKLLQKAIDSYLQMVKQHAPELQRKAKTHLLVDVVDDIKRHGPPKCYSEDAFEKNHGTIRGQIFLENQKARSMDTCTKFAKQMICHHVLNGGFFKDSEEWKSGSENVLLMAKRQEVVKFLGMPHDQLNEKHQQYPISEAPTEELLMLLAGEQLSAEDQIKTGKAVRIGKDIVNAGDWVEFQNSEEDISSGVFKEGIIVQPRRGSAKMYCVIQRAEDGKDDDAVLGCPIVQLTQDIIAIHSSKLSTTLDVIHDCTGGMCNLVTTDVRERVEQEEVNIRKVTIDHNMDHRRYIINNFTLKD